MTDIAALSGSVRHWEGDALLVLAREEDCEKCDVPHPYGEYIRELAKRGDFDGKKGSLVRVPLFHGRVKNLYAAGLGKAEECTPAALRDALTAALRKIGRQRNRSALALTGAAGTEADVILGEAVGLCGYAFDK